MYCRITELREKEVININDGSRLGCVGDIELDTCTGQLVSIVIFGRKWLGFFGKSEDIIVYWNDIEVIGDETILVSLEKPKIRTEKSQLIPRIFGS